MPANSVTRSFLDTNIWLYAFIEANNPVKSAVARKLIQDVAPVVSTQVINEVCVNMLKKAHLPEDQSRQLVESFYQKYEVIEATQSIFLSASQLRQSYSLSYWDSMIVASAISANVAILYSEDMHHELIVNGRVQILNPFV